MRKPITNKGIKWEIMNSIWMLWAILSFGFFNYVSFFYAAYRVKQRKWFIWGLLYSIPFILFVISMEAIDEKHWLDDLIFAIYFIAWIVSIIHVFKMRAEYLLRLEARVSLKENELEQLKKSIKKEYEALDGPSIDETVKNKADMKDGKVNIEGRAIDRPIDINTATEEEIASISAIGGLLAKKVVAVRAQEGGFRSLEHFAESLQLKPHVIEKIKPFVKFPEVEAARKQGKHEGRVVDF
ncbi:helix-hairpin-helix domain-containing protein [Geobacillus zalihae]|uniref:helix-hairpin-helix domain-containing protein n=1 Tax=Geobacillus zalihae TaxID=213419 RepID=UPI000764048D|nr:helix-hairpin-helix domain-containing protein [Geobacillus zalihae]